MSQSNPLRDDGSCLHLPSINYFSKNLQSQSKSISGKTKLIIFLLNNWSSVRSDDTQFFITESMRYVEPVSLEEPLDYDSDKDPAYFPNPGWVHDILLNFHD